MTNDIADLRQTIDTLLKERYSTLPQDLVRQLVSIEAEFIDNRSEAVKRIREAVELHLATEGS